MYIYMYWLLVAAVACVDSRLLFVAEVKRCDLFAHFYRTSHIYMYILGACVVVACVDLYLFIVTVRTAHCSSIQTVYGPIAVLTDRTDRTDRQADLTVCQFAHTINGPCTERLPL